MKKVLACALSLILMLTLAACAGQSRPADTLVLHDGMVSEVRLMSRIVKYLVEEHTNLKVNMKDQMTSVNIFNEMQAGNVDVMTSYDGTLLTTYLHMDPADVPPGQTLYDFANYHAREQKDVFLLEKVGINNTYAVGVAHEVAAELNLNTISDLALVADQLIFGAEHEFFSEEGMAKFSPFSAFYGLNFKEVRQIDVNLKYTAAENRNIDVMIVYTTDGLNKKANLKVLEDDRNYFPEYNLALLVPIDLFERKKDAAPNLEEVLNKLAGQCTSEEMVELTYAVDVEGRDLDDVALEFLRTRGLIA